MDKKLWMTLIYRGSSLIVTMVFSFIISSTVVYAVPVYGQRPCTQPAYNQPFTGISSCDWVNSICSATASIFTWTPQDTSVDTGYDRIRNFFVSQGWQRENSEGTYLPVRLSSGFIDNYMIGNGAAIPQHLWQENHRQHHLTIAYSVIAPLVQAPRLYVFVTQFEFPANSVDVNNIPLPTAKPLRTRLWSLEVGLGSDNSGKIHTLDNYGSRSLPLGQVIWDAHERVHLDVNKQYYVTFSVPTPPVGQNLTQRWSCQRIDYTTPGL